MHHLLASPLLAAASAASDNSHAVLFGNRGLALVVILLGVAVFIALVALIGRVLAATHPDETVAPPDAKPAAAAAPAPVIADSLPPEVMVAIAAAVSVTLGPKVKIAEIRTPAPSVEALMQTWALEGRRQIYTSHTLR